MNYPKLSRVLKYLAIFLVSFFSAILVNFLIWIFQGIAGQGIFSVFGFQFRSGGWPFSFFDQYLNFSLESLALDILFWFIFVSTWFLAIFAFHDLMLKKKDI